MLRIFIARCHWVLVLSVGACSGKTDEDEAALSSSSENPRNQPCVLGECAPTPDRVSAIPGPSCPADEPLAGSACNLNGTECTFGDSATADCRRYYRCTNSEWELPAERNASCVSQPASQCPREPSPEGRCTAGDVDVFVPCEYNDGIACYCLGNPVGVPGATGEWECYGPPAARQCPELLPNIGEGCAQTGQFCRYGVVGLGCRTSYASAYCYQGAWEAAMTSCLL